MEKQHDKGKQLMRRAKICFASGQLAQSIEFFSLAMEWGYDPVEAYLNRGAAHMALGNHRLAGEDFTRVLQRDKRNERASYYRGIAAIALGKYEEAIADLTASLKQNNDRGIAHLMRGLAYAELGHDADAVLDINSGSAFSQAEIGSFRKLFGENSTLFTRSKALLSRENAPWNNLISRDSAARLLNFLG